jgi:hypothetical protein
MSRDSQKAFQSRGRGRVFEGNYQLTHTIAIPWEENIVRLAALKSYEED